MKSSADTLRKPEPFMILFLCLAGIMLLFRGSSFSMDRSTPHAGTQEITIASVGDIMMGSIHPVEVLPPEDGKGIFDAVRNDLQGDLVFGNLEGPLADGTTPTKCAGRAAGNCFEFVTPTRYAKHLKSAGFSVMGIANNHTLDCGTTGITSTLAALAGAGIKPAGGEAVARLRIKDKNIAVAAFSFKGHQYAYSVLDLEEAARIVSALKEQNDIVIVSFHAGKEGKTAIRVRNEDEVFLGEARGNVVRFSRTVIDAGADLVIGHGPHVLRALDLYKGKLIAYSLGNFLTYGFFNLKGPNGVSIILRVSLDPKTGDFANGRIIPVRLLNGGIPEPDPSGEAISILQDLIQKDSARSEIILESNGTIRFKGNSSPGSPPLPTSGKY
jgi:hypothetical protein